MSSLRSAHDFKCKRDFPDKLTLLREDVHGSILFKNLFVAMLTEIARQYQV